MNSEQKSQQASSSDQSQAIENLIAILLGLSPELSRNNPEAVQAAFLNFYTELKQSVGDSISKNPAEVENLSARINSLQETLQAQGIEVGKEIEKELLHLLQELFSPANVDKYVKECVSKLRELADEIDRSPELVGEKIDETIQSLSKDLFVEEEMGLESKRKQQYSQSAQDAIAQSFKSLRGY